MRGGGYERKVDLPLSGSPRRRMVIVGASSMDRLSGGDGTYFYKFRAFGTFALPYHISVTLPRADVLIPAPSHFGFDSGSLTERATG